LLWYYDAHDYAKSLANQFNIQLCQSAAVISVLSPGCAWTTNKDDAMRVMETWNRGQGPHNIICTTYKPQVRKAFEILSSPGTPAEMVPMIGTPNARKTIAFYWNILEPDDWDYVTIDRWISRAIMLNAEAKHPSKTVYHKVQAAFKDVASGLNITPCQCQAIVWLVVRDCGLMGQEYLL
jgi:hypothetical protein